MTSKIISSIIAAGLIIAGVVIIAVDYGKNAAFLAMVFISAIVFLGIALFSPLK